MLKTIAGRIGLMGLLIISIAVFGAGIFVTQPITDLVRGGTDRYHSNCGAIMIFLFPVFSTLIAYSLSKHLTGRTEKLTLWLVTFLVWAGILTFISALTIYGEQVKIRDYSDKVLIGYPNRFMVAT